MFSKSQLILAFLAYNAISAIGFCIVFYFVVIASIELKNDRLPMRRYLLLINLAIGDCLQLFGFTVLCTFTLISSSNLFQKHVGLKLMFFFSIPLTGSCLSMLTYATLNIFQLLAIAKPIFYHTTVATKHCSLLIALIWMASLAYAAPVSSTFLGFGYVNLAAIKSSVNGYYISERAFYGTS